MNEAAISVAIITGFLGAGKTTLLGYWLNDPALADAVVFINEFGAVGIDHHLLEDALQDVVLLENGCLCCSLQEDFVAQIQDLLSRRARGVLPQFKFLLIETTGLADPLPILSAFLSDPVLASCCAVPEVVTLVDGVHYERIVEQPVALTQIACADLLIVTKTDQLALTQIHSIESDLALRSSAQLFTSTFETPLSAQNLVQGALQGGRFVRQNLHANHGKQGHHHGPKSYSFETASPQTSQRLNLWIAGLLREHGHFLLRMKGIFEVSDEARSVVLQAVGQAFDPPREVAKTHKGTRVVLIFDTLPDGFEAESLFAELAQ